MEGNHVGKMMKSKKNVNSIFTLFSNLTSEKNQDPRYCVELVKTLYGEQFNIGTTNNFVYSIKRIVKALGSTRPYSQCGCFAALTCILKYGACSVEDVLKALEKEQQHSQGATKTEIRSLDTECVLACGAIIQSGLFAEQPAIIQQSILSKLIEGGKRKRYLSTVVHRFIIDVVHLLDEKQFKECVWPICKTELLANFNEPNCSIECFYLITVCMIKCPKVLSKFLKKKSCSDTSFSEQLVAHLFNNSVKCTHPIYEKAAQLLCMNEKNLIELWSKCVEENAKISQVKDNLLLVLFLNIMKHLEDGTTVPSLLIPKFIDVLIKVLTFKKTKSPYDNNCHSTARAGLALMTELLKKQETSDEARFHSIQKLLFYPANMKFEMKTGTKITQQLISQLKTDSIVKLLEIYKQIITDGIKKRDEEGNEENWNNKEKQIALGSLIKTINHPSVRNAIPLKLEQIKFIFEVGFLNKYPFGLDLKKYAQESFYKAVILQMPSLKDLLFLLDDLVMHVNNHIESKSFDVSEEVLEWWKRQFSVVQKLQKDLSNKFFIAVHVLLIYMGFQLFWDLDLAKGSIQELLSCYAHIKQVESRKKSKKVKNATDGNSEGELHWTEVTIDLILSLLSRENKLWRHVISCIFPQVVAHATPTALHQIVEALDPKTDKVILEEINSDESDGEDEETESSASDSDDSELEDCDQEEKANDQLRMAVREALGYSAALTDDESVDMDQMNEEEEKKLNESLAEAFRMFKPGSRGKKKKQTKEEEALMHFRLRVLDLVEMYTFSNPSMQGCLDLLLPLLNVLELTIKDIHQIPLRTRVDSILKTVTSVKNFTNVQNVDRTCVKELFQAVITKKEVSALVFVEMAPRISDCTTFLVRCSNLLPDEGGSDEIGLVDEYNGLLKAFFQARDLKLPIGMFQSVMKMTWKGCFKLIGTLFQFLSSPSIRIFKKLKIIELLQLFYKNEKLHCSSVEEDKLALTSEEINFIKLFNSFLAEYEKNESKASEKIYVTFFSQIIMLINVVRNNMKRHRPQMKRNPPWESVVLALARTDTVKRNKKTRSQLVNLANLLNVTSAVTEKLERKRKACQEENGETEEEEMAEKATSEEEIEEMEEPRRKKKKKISNGFVNFKTEARKLREEVSSNGLEVFKFSSVDLKSLPDADL